MMRFSLTQKPFHESLNVCLKIGIFILLLHVTFPSIIVVQIPIIKEGSKKACRESKPTRDTPINCLFFRSRKQKRFYPRFFSFSSRAGTKSGPCRGTPLGPVVMRRPVLSFDQSEAAVWAVDQWEARYVCHLLFTPGDLGVRTWGRVSQRQWATLIMDTCTKMLKWLFQKDTLLKSSMPRQ